MGAGGAGLVAAWLLEERHDVTVFERDDRLGGHLHSLSVPRARSVVSVDVGTHFVSRRMYPRFVKLLEHLAVPRFEYPQTLTFYDRASRTTVCLPPTGSVARYKTMLGKGALASLVRFGKLLEAAALHVERGDWATTFDEYLARRDLPSEFVTGFVRPFFASNWGVKTAEIGALSARAVLSYATVHRLTTSGQARWLAIEGGASRYVHELRSALGSARIVSGQPVSGIRRDGGAYAIETAGETAGPFDAVVLATNAEDARAALSPLAGAGALRATLGAFEYFDTRIAVHRDASLLPADRGHWSTVNLCRESDFCAIHQWSGWREGADLFRSWITHYPTKPRDVVAEITYRHARPTPAYYAAQDKLDALQGREGLSFVGVYTRGFDNHESALSSAVDAARRLGAGSRVALFD